MFKVLNDTSINFSFFLFKITLGSSQLPLIIFYQSIRIMKNLFGLILFALFFTSCASMKMEDLKPVPKNKTLLPTLTPRIDLSSFESAYSLGNTDYSTSGAVVNQVSIGDNANGTIGIGIGGYETSSTRTKDLRIQDAITIFDRDVKDNITDPYNDSKGVILCKINASNVKTNYLWPLLSGFTLAIPNLFGMPFGAQKIILDVDVEIYDKSDKLIARYNSIGEHKIYSAMYWGYGFDAPRVNNIKAFRNAMDKIKNKIEDDSQKITKKLN